MTSPVRGQYLSSPDSISIAAETKLRDLITILNAVYSSKNPLERKQLVPENDASFNADCQQILRSENIPLIWNTLSDLKTVLKAITTAGRTHLQCLCKMAFTDLLTRFFLHFLYLAPEPLSRWCRKPLQLLPTLPYEPEMLCDRSLHMLLKCELLVATWTEVVNLSNGYHELIRAVQSNSLDTPPHKKVEKTTHTHKTSQIMPNVQDATHNNHFDYTW